MRTLFVPFLFLCMYVGGSLKITLFYSNGHNEPHMLKAWFSLTTDSFLGIGILSITMMWNEIEYTSRMNISRMKVGCLKQNKPTKQKQ